MMENWNVGMMEIGMMEFGMMEFGICFLEFGIFQHRVSSIKQKRSNK
jgi:hypothetical protein